MFSNRVSAILLLLPLACAKSSDVVPGPGAGTPDAGHDQSLDDDQRLRVADPARGEPAEVAVEGVVHVHRGQAEIDRERQPWVVRHGARGERVECGHELRPASRFDLESGGAGVAAMAEEQVAAGIERRPEIEPPVAPA